ncbi:ribosome small subunit-dependent GTPase A [Candidatus Roizmanbacteria bacterium]|nr:ribosome small subunit-dependent GTPase A [Candidatus Roizmanbacteria bacterium]
MKYDTKMSLADLGLNAFFEAQMRDHEFPGGSLARVVAEYKEAYRVRGVNGEFLARVTGKHRFIATTREDYPAVGDWVSIEELPEEMAIIWGILPRKTLLKRKRSLSRKTTVSDGFKQEEQIIAANIDSAFIVESLDRDYNLNRLERYLVLVTEGNITPVIILNKADLIPQAELELRVSQIQGRLGSIHVIATSVIKDQGLDELRRYIETGKTYCFLGSSGVGKSSLINKLLGTEEIKTRAISLSVERGRHTTTTREMYFLETGGIVIDNPGTREVGITNADTGLNTVFNEINRLSRKCKYSDCSHSNEPGCAVLRAVAEEQIDRDQYDNYIKLKAESAFYSLTDVEKRNKDRKFGQFLKKAKTSLKNSYE